ncbi:MAG: DUF1801 domain-containing protein [Bacteroidota bacterium]
MTQVKLSDEEQVSAHIAKLDPALQPAIAYLRQSILSVDPEIGERIKWNNPSFYFTGEMADFDPKEYRRDMIVLNLHKGRIMLVFPSGGKVNDTSGFLEGKYADGRRTVVFGDLNDIKAKEKQLREIIRSWLALLEK